LIQFDADKKYLTFLLDQIENRDLALPDFQRSFVWDPGATRELVVSIIRSFPAGSLLLMKGGASIFAPREFEGAPGLAGQPAYLVLDGQQRLTSLYQALVGRGSHKFFLNLRELIDGHDADEAVEVYPVKRAKRWETVTAQAKDLMLPLSRLRSFAEWKDDVLDALEGRDQDLKKLSKQLNELEREFVKPVEQYLFPVTTLPDGTPADAVCTIFETLNRTGLKLSVFELITARAFAEEVRLREMWTEAQAQHPILMDFDVDPYYLLQVIALTERNSPKRGVVLALPVGAIVDRWKTAVSGMSGALRLLRDECGVLVPKWLPYATMLIPMAAAWSTAIAQPGPAEGARRAKLKRWFWCSVFAGTYDNTANSTAERDYPELVAWLEERGGEPTAVRTFSFTPERWREVTYRQRALYRASMALLMRHHPLDFHKAKPLTKQSIDEEGVDDHHVFPRNYLKGAAGVEVVDSVLNHTLIDRLTNIRIGDKAPSAYLGDMEKELGKDLHGILESHRLPSDHEGSLFGDRFEDFLSWRIEHLTSELAEVTGSEPDEHGVLWAPRATAETGVDFGESDKEADDSALGQDIVALIHARQPNPARRERLLQFLDQACLLAGLEPWVGKSIQTKDGWAYSVNLARRGRTGSFAYIYPSSMKILFRMKHSDAKGVSPVELRNVAPQNLLRVRASLADAAGFEACLELVKRAYDRTFRKD
jgi:hypothetical protein